MSVLDHRETDALKDNRAALDRTEGDQPSMPETDKKADAGHSRWMMIACCIPMLAIAGIVVAAGGGVGFLVIAVMCTAMMAAMMGGMSRGSGDGSGDDSGPKPR